MAVSSPSSLMQYVLDVALPHFVALHERFLCIVCRVVLRDPWQTECGHRMCFNCMNGLFVDVPEVRCPAKEEDCEMITREKVRISRYMHSIGIKHIIVYYTELFANEPFLTWCHDVS